MWWLITFVLATGLGAALWRLGAQRRAVLALRDAIERRRPMLREELSGAVDSSWERLCDASTGLIDAVNELDVWRRGQLSQLEATLGSLQEAVLVVDANNYVQLANRALTAMFPQAQEVMRQRLELVLHSAAFLSYVEEVRRQGARPQREVEFFNGRGTVWAEVTGSAIAPLDGGKSPWMLFVLHNVTRQKQLETMRKDFVANVSHELRTPLSVIKGYVETLVDGQGEIPAEEQARFLRTIQRHAERLNALLEDLLTLSRLESTNPQLLREPVDLGRMLTQVVEDYRSRPAAAGHELTLELEGEGGEGARLGRVPADPLKLSQVWENLIENALKYTPAGSRIRLSAKRRDGEVVVCVGDDGPGIPREDLTRVFERFYRVDKGRSRETGGTGLGLSIVKHIVQSHGGRVWVESEQGRGAAFFVALPVQRE